jgi:hypothetical protein
MSMNNIIDGSEKNYECCDGCGIVTNNINNILKLDCMCCSKENIININICLICVQKYKIIGFEHCKNKYPKIFKYINSMLNTTNKSKKFTYSQNELDTIYKELLYKNNDILNGSLLYKKINDYDDLNQNIYSYRKLNYERSEIFEIDNYGLYIFNNFYCNKCIKEKCVFFCPLHNKMTIDKNKNNEEIVNINMIELKNNSDDNIDELSIYKCPYIHRILDMFVYEV